MGDEEEGIYSESAKEKGGGLASSSLDLFTTGFSLLFSGIICFA
jgi:hypothetical protein